MNNLNKLLQKRLFPIAIFLFLSSCVQAEIKKIPITEDSVNLSARVFLNEFVSQEEGARKVARLYLLGVMDTTEGRTWCDYKKLSTATLNEFIFEYMKKSTPIQLERRASTVIEDALHASFPCKVKL
jgi:hypothetical protein